MKTVGKVLAALGAVLVAILLCLLSARRVPENRSVLESRPIRLAARTVDPATCANPPDPPAESLSSRGTCAYVVQSVGPVSAAVRDRVAWQGARVISYLPTDALLVEATPESVRALLKTKVFSAAFPYLPSDKIQRGLTGGLVTVMPLAASDRGRLVDFVRENGGQTMLDGPSRQGSFRADVSGNLLQQLAARGDVRWLERYVPPKVSNEYATADTGVRQVWDPHGLTGAGQVISSADSGLDTGVLQTLHHDLTNRVIAIENLGGFTTADTSGHGTHTAGILAGNGEMSGGLHRGVAPESRLYIQACGDGTSGRNIYFDNAETYADIFAAGIPFGSYIHSDSWGNDDAGAYSDFSIGLDEVAWENPELLVVVAAGNAGPGAQTVGSPATAKNALSVGNTYSSRDNRDATALNGSSSRGPCADGRIKPDVAAPGTSIVSMRSSLSSLLKYDDAGFYAKMTGTSMATPHVAGCAALTRQWLVERRGYTNAVPTAALVKAVLTGGAVGGLPDNNFGFGRISLEETLFPSNRAVRLIDRIPYTAGCTIPYGVATTNAAPLDVQLVWTDYPGEASAASALVNDLDLVVSNRTTGAVWSGNGIVGGDRSNNVESVRIPLAEAGDYAVIVRGANIPYDSSAGGAAALYVRGAFAAEGESGEEESVTLTVETKGASNSFYLTAPDIGSRVYPKGSILTLEAGVCSYGTNAYGTVVSAFGCRGYSGTGSVPSFGFGSSLQVALEEDSSVTWRYDTTPQAYALRLYTFHPGDSWYLPSENGPENTFLKSARWVWADDEVTVDIPGGLPMGDAYAYEGILYTSFYGMLWEERTASVTMKLGDVELATADEYGEFCYDERLRLAKRISFRMDGAKDVLGWYYDTTEMFDSVLPAWWFFRYLAGSFESGVLTESDVLQGGDPDGDGFANAGEYSDETDPVDDASFRFKIDAFSPTNMVFTGSVKGSLVVERSDSLGGLWTSVHVESPPRESTVNHVGLTPGSGSNAFYRVIYLAD